MKKAEEQKQESSASMDTWAKRRKFMVSVCWFCGAVILYVLWQGADSKIAETAITMAFITLTSIVMGYVFGATVEDISKLKMK